MENNCTALSRLNTSTPKLDAEEIDWWEKFADVEEQFCWVQTPAIQKFLRGQYLHRIINLCSSNARIAELGCGTGWLSILLAKMGAEKVFGLDFSEAQIQKARKRAIEAGVDRQVSFQTIDASNLNLNSDKYDAIVLHGFLHHLTTTEIDRVMATVFKMLNPNGRLIIWEPVRYQSGEITKTQRRLFERMEFLKRLTLKGQRLKLRRMNTQERQTREAIAQRFVGELPRGPSPKEMPFEPDELPALISHYFTVQKRERCMASTHLVAQETLLMELSQPWLARLVRWPLLTIARYTERRILSLEPPPSDIWIFEMFECTAKKIA
jgi:2-polyprenyl-3-methyl-5-hydroxy-6-metoxy-1,4-benzoquinol methylase